MDIKCFVKIDAKVQVHIERWIRVSDWVSVTQTDR